MIVIIILLKDALSIDISSNCKEILKNHSLSGERWNKTFTFTRPGL